MRAVKAAKLHINLFIEGVGDMGATLPPQNKKFRELYLTYGDEGLEVLVNGHHVLVTPSTVAYVEFKKADLKAVS